MKPIIFIVLTLVGTSQVHAMFGHVAAERQQRMEVEQKLVEQQRLTEEQEKLTSEQQAQTARQQELTTRWQTIAFVLGIAVSAALLIGAAVGSKTRQEAA